MKKIFKTLLGASFATVAFAGIANADAVGPTSSSATTATVSESPSNVHNEKYVQMENRWGVGVFFNSTTPTNFLPMVTYDGAGWNAGLGATYQHDGSNSSNNFYASGYLGTDLVYIGNLVISAGVAGGLTLNSPANTTRTYNIGPYAGADYYFADNFKASAQLIVLNYQQKAGSKNWNAFSQGSIGISYMFN